MKFFFLSMWLLLIPLYFVIAQDDRDGSRITFNNTTHNFGDIQQGDTVSHTFKFRNTGNQPLVISNVLTTCGCTVPKWSKEPIAPNQAGEIQVRFDSAGRSGRQNKVVTIVSNAVSPQTRISVMANILPSR